MEAFQKACFGVKWLIFLSSSGPLVNESRFSLLIINHATNQIEIGIFKKLAFFWAKLAN